MKRLVLALTLAASAINALSNNKPLAPTTKAAEGHDEDISKEEIIAQGIVSREDYEQLEAYTRAIFQRGTEIAAKMGLILVDTKYEFGKKDGKIYLMDEIHTPDSSRYFYAEGYAERLAAGQKQKHRRPKRIFDVCFGILRFNQRVFNTCADSMRAAYDNQTYFALLLPPLGA